MPSIFSGLAASVALLLLGLSEVAYLRTTPPLGSAGWDEGVLATFSLLQGQNILDLRVKSFRYRLTCMVGDIHRHIYIYMHHAYGQVHAEINT